jgi:DNA replication protein DnaC
LVKGDPTPSLILNGGVGTGKTALAACIVGEVIDSRTVRLKKAIDLVRELKETWKKDNLQTEKEIIKFYSELDLLIIDEIGMQFGSDTERLFIFDVIDGRYNENKPTIIITNLGMEAVTKTIGERTVDRLREDGGQMIRFDWESYRKN